MGNIQTLHDTGSSYEITPKMDGGVYAVATTDCVIKGVGDEFAVTYSSDSLNIQFNAGSQAVIGGAFFKVMALEAVTLTANATIYLCANIDLSRANGETGAFVQRTSSNMQSDNLNGSGTSRDLLLYIITTGSSGVTNVVDKRTIKESAGLVYGTATNKFLRNDGQWTTIPSSAISSVSSSAIPFGINASNKICSLSATGSSVSWTATADCFAYLFGTAYGSIKVDGVQLAGSTEGNFSPNQMWLPLRKGSTVVCSGANTNTIWAWALKS